MTSGRVPCLTPGCPGWVNASSGHVTCRECRRQAYTPDPTGEYAPGMLVLISCECPNRSLRLEHGYVVRRTDKGRILLVRLLSNYKLVYVLRDYALPASDD